MLGGMDGRYSQGISKADPLQNQTNNIDKTSDENQTTNKVGKKALQETSSNTSSKRITEDREIKKEVGFLKNLANKISNFFASIFGSNPSAATSSNKKTSSDISLQESSNQPVINKEKFLEEMDGEDVFKRDSLGGGIVNGTIIFGNGGINIPTIEVDLYDENSKKICEEHYNENLTKITNFLSRDPDLQLCEKVLKTLMSQTITVINETSASIQLEELTMKYIEKVTKNENLTADPPKNTLDYTFTIKSTNEEITIEVRGTNKYELNLKENAVSLPAEGQLKPVIVDVQFDIVIKKDKNEGHIKQTEENGEKIDKIVDFEIRNEKVKQRS